MAGFVLPYSVAANRLRAQGLRSHWIATRGTLRLAHRSSPWRIGLAMQDDDEFILRPFDAREAIRVNVAARLAGVAPRTIQYWCTVHRIGRRVGGGHWRVSRVALAMHLDGDEEALRLYLGGDRASTRVAAYFRRAGL
jgi:hypothetical protein